jgi:hypothetical protein
VKEDEARRSAEKEVGNVAESDVEAKNGNRKAMTDRGNEIVNVKRE